MSENENAPARESEGASDTSNPATNCSQHSRNRVSELHARATGYAVLVETPHGNFRRRLYLTLASAQNARQRAHDRGQYAAIVLVQLVPVTGGEH